MKRCVPRALLAGALCVCLLLPAPAGAVSTSAAAAVLLDADSGRVLYAQNAHKGLPIASVTKLMTALVAVERAPDLDAPVPVDPRAVGLEGSSLYLAPGETLPLRTLLYGLLLHSGNDAAVAIALFCAGDVDVFVGWMNERARALGLEHTHFMNPSGLDDPDHYASAYDMALIAREVLRHPDLARIAATRSIVLGERSLTNHNKLLWRYEGCVGLKTGYTRTAGRTLVSAATREGATLIAVTLRDPNDWADHAALLDYGFAHYPSRLLVGGGMTLALVPVAGSLPGAVPAAAASPVRACLAPGEEVSARVTLAPRLEAPVAEGDVVGTLTFSLGGQVVGRTQLLAGASAPSCRPGGLRTLGAVLPIPPAVFDLAAAPPLWRGP